MENDLPEEQQNISKVPPQLQAHVFKKGVSGNPGGRPVGTISLKEYAKKYLRELNDEQKQEFMEGLPKEVIWKMSEGNPQTDVTSKGEKINPMPILGGITNDKIPEHNSDKENPSA